MLKPWQHHELHHLLMMRVAFIVVCCALMGGFLWLAHQMVYGYGREFGIGFGLGSTAMALIASTYISLRYGD